MALPCLIGIGAILAVWDEEFGLLQLVGALLWIANSLSLLTYLRQLAQMMPAPRLVRHMRLAMFGAVLLGVVFGI